MADKYTELAANKEVGSVFISHGDCEKDAQLLADMLKERHGIEVQIITNVGPVIGAHSGPGTLALFFVGNKR
jgi:fatty acid-binding protein DegV